MWKNKHVIAAMIIAPILAVISYFAVDSLVAEQPHKAMPGEQVQLIEKPNCRYTSGECELKNGDFELRITGKWLDEVNLSLTFESDFPLEGIIASHVYNTENSDAPINLRPLDDTKKHWTLSIVNPNTKQDRLRIAAQANQAVYYGDAALVFIDYKTAFENDFR
jgi:hypothetical protein